MLGSLADQRLFAVSRAYSERPASPNCSMRDFAAARRCSRTASEIVYDRGTSCFIFHFFACMSTFRLHILFRLHYA